MGGQIREQIHALKLSQNAPGHSSDVDASRCTPTNNIPELHECVEFAVREVLNQHVDEIQAVGQSSLDTVAATSRVFADLRDCAEVKPLLAELVCEETELCNRLKEVQ